MSSPYDLLSWELLQKICITPEYLQTVNNYFIGRVKNMRRTYGQYVRIKKRGMKYVNVKLIRTNFYRVFSTSIIPDIKSLFLCCAQLIFKDFDVFNCAWIVQKLSL